MSRLWVTLAVAAQLLVLAWMAGEREWILRTGPVVYLRTAPIDPRDLFRGDFVRLQYEINSVRREDLDATLGTPAADRRRHEVVYTRLRPAGEGLYEAAGTSTAPPGDGPFLRGRTEHGWRMGWRGTGHFFVTYGIEQLFVEQGRGLDIEKRRGGRGDLQVPMEVEVAVGSGGTAVIRGYRWSRLGIKLEVLRRPAPRNRNAPPPEGPLSPKLRITLANTSDVPLSVADAGEHCAFQLVAVEWATTRHAPASRACIGAPDAVRTLALAPGESYSVELDLSDARWHVLDEDKPVEIGALTGFPQFRIEYRAPEAVSAPAEAPLWRGRMLSQAFNATGVID